MKCRLLSATALTALSFSALAADLPSRTSPPTAPAPLFTWTGFYVGGSLGAVLHGGDFTVSGNTSSNFRTGSHLRPWGLGVIGGVGAGYNHQFDRLVAGVEADYSLSNVSGHSSIVGPYGLATAESRLKSLGTLRARFGYSFDRTLVFITGGLALGRVQSSLDDAGLPARPVYRTNGMRTGYVIGGGVEHAITDRWTVKGEALYYDLRKRSAESQYGAYSDTAAGLIARAGVNFRY